MKYKATAKDAEIDPEAALLQAVLALDAAGIIAEQAHDVEGLLNVSAMWMKFGETISGIADHLPTPAELRGHQGGTGDFQTGFQKSDDKPIGDTDD